MRRFLHFCLFYFIISSPIHAAEQKLTVVLDWFINPNHAPLLVAELQGFFKQQGLSVKFISPTNPTDGAKLVASSQADIAITYHPNLLLQVDQGLPLMRFATLIKQPLACVIVLKNSSIYKFTDLKGKKIGYSSCGIDEIMMQTMLKHHHLIIADIKLINVQYNLIQGLFSQNVDAIVGGMRNFEPLQIHLLGKEALLFYPEENGFPTYEELILITNTAQKDDIRLKKFIIALTQGIRHLMQNPDKDWLIVTKHYPELNNTLNRQAWFASLNYFALDPNILAKEKYDHLAEFMYQEKLIQHKLKLSVYAQEINHA